MRRLREADAGVSPRAHRRRRLATVLAMLAVVVAWLATPSAQVRRPVNRPAAPRAARHAPLKAIFEPVGYPGDVDISDVFFADADTGWASGHHSTGAGNGGFIIGTRDGGKTWSVQFGDRNSTTDAVARLFFLDATHGWATQVDGTLLRTIDGSKWAAAGSVDPLSPVVFISPERGFFLRRAQGIQTTMDGGRTWRLGYLCDPAAIAFAPDGATGYAVTRGAGYRTAAILKTTDAGERWTPASLVHDVDVSDVSLAFSDAGTGYMRAGAALKMTTNGGRTWHLVTARVPNDASKILVAGSVGWMVGSHEFNYTLDGGTRWIERRIDFPAHVISFTLVSADTGYVAGSHGMIYRYRVVPFDYEVPHMLTIPGMTTFVSGDW